MKGVIRAVPRIALAAIFIDSGRRVLMDPSRQVRIAEEQLPVRPPRLDLIARAQAGVHVVGGVALALGLRADLAAGALALTLFPVTYVGHPFWTIEDPQQRNQQRVHFLKNLGLFGGLVYVAADSRRHAAEAD